jgi:hypothetical protein
MYTIMTPGVPDNEKAGIRAGRFTITREEMDSIFMPMVQKVIKLVNEQIEATGGGIQT